MNSACTLLGLSRDVTAANDSHGRSSSHGLFIYALCGAYSGAGRPRWTYRAVRRSKVPAAPTSTVAMEGIAMALLLSRSDLVASASIVDMICSMVPRKRGFLSYRGKNSEMETIGYYKYSRHLAGFPLDRTSGHGDPCGRRFCF